MENTMTDRKEDARNGFHRPVPTRVIRALASSLDSLMSISPAVVIAELATHATGSSIVPTILEFAIGKSANCSSGCSCVQLYLALQGLAAPLEETTTGMDAAHLEWWLRAIVEHATGRWGGTVRGVEAIATTQPVIYQQAEAAMKAWRL
jgi:hypothetical protein